MFVRASTISHTLLALRAIQRYPTTQIFSGAMAQSLTEQPQRQSESHLDGGKSRRRAITFYFTKGWLE
jgi:hypothetical protein